jgi:hypothetical protein
LAEDWDYDILVQKLAEQVDRTRDQ